MGLPDAERGTLDGSGRRGPASLPLGPGLDSPPGAAGLASAAGAAGFAGGGAAAGGRDGPLEPLDVTTRFGGAPPGGGLVGTGAAGAVGTAGGAAGGGVAAVGAAAAGAAGAGPGSWRCRAGAGLPELAQAGRRWPRSRRRRCGHRSRLTYRSLWGPVWSGASRGS